MELDGPSLPAWGVWIEIQIKLAKPYISPSLPAWGVWIEIGGVQWPDDER